MPSKTTEMGTTMTHKPFISVVICTYNNADSLKITIDQLMGQSLKAPQLFEFIVVDNNSKDHTNNIVKSYRSEKTPYHSIFEPRQGLSHARNTGVAAAKGEYILFTDDDAELHPDWLESYLSKIRSTHADCIFGRISVIWDQPKPWWYDDRYSGFFAVINYGDKKFIAADKKTPFFGKNFCIKKDFLIDMGGFDPELGRKGDDLIGGEEILIFNRLIERNMMVLYFPDIDVGHRLKPREYTEENIRKQYMACAKPIVQIAKTQPGKELLGRKLGVLEIHLKEILGAMHLLILSKLTGDKKESFFQRMRVMRAFKVVYLWLKN